MFKLKRKYSHITPRYILNRIKQWNYERTHKDLPWLNKNGNEYLEKIICKDWRVVEFGGGRSSSFFLKKVQKLITIEHDYKYYKKIKENNSKYIDNNQFEIYNLNKKEEFLNFINNLDSQSLDLVFVDSIFRYLVTSTILDKIKINGFLIVDNINRFIPTNTFTPIDSGRKENEFLNSEWKKLFKEKLLEKYSLKITSDGVSDTGFFIKKLD